MGNTCKSMANSCQCMTKTLQYCKVISLQLIKINETNKKHESYIPMFLGKVFQIFLFMTPKEKNIFHVVTRYNIHIHNGNKSFQN